MRKHLLFIFLLALLNSCGEQGEIGNVQPSLNFNQFCGIVITAEDGRVLGRFGTPVSYYNRYRSEYVIAVYEVISDKYYMMPICPNPVLSRFWITMIGNKQTEVNFYISPLAVNTDIISYNFGISNYVQVGPNSMTLLNSGLMKIGTNYFSFDLQPYNLNSGPYRIYIEMEDATLFQDILFFRTKDEYHSFMNLYLR